MSDQEIDPDDVLYWNTTGWGDAAGLMEMAGRWEEEERIRQEYREVDDRGGS